jgi:hypothetical protein
MTAVVIPGKCLDAAVKVSLISLPAAAIPLVAVIIGNIAEVEWRERGASLLRAARRKA